MYQEGEKAGGRYRLIRKLGDGGMGSTWLVLDENLGKHWAMKICEEKQRPGGADSFSEECMALRDVDSVCFPRIVEAFQENGYRCLVMDWIRGITLEERILERGALRPGEAVAVAEQLCGALQVLHQRTPPILHLDLKPSNIMLTGEGVRLIDFGSALSGWEGLHACSGTPGYASPEQLGVVRERTGSRPEVDERSDIYGLGALLLAMLTGRRPQQEQPGGGGVAGIPKPLWRIVRRAMHPDREKRFQSVEELTEALRRTNGKNRRRRAAYILKTGISAGLIFFAACQGAELMMICHELWEKGIPERITAGQMADGLLPALLCCLWEGWTSWFYRRHRSKGGGRCMYRQEKSRLRTDKRGQIWIGICAGIIGATLAAGPAAALYAKGSGPDTDGLPVVLRDERMRKLLIREGGICEITGPLYLEIPRELLEGGEILQVSIEGKKGDGPPRMYAFSCRLKQE